MNGDSGFSQAEVESFKADGYVVARGLVAPELAAAVKVVARRELDAAVPPLEYEAETHYPGAPSTQEAPGGRTVRRLLQAFARDPTIARCATLPAVATRLKQLLGPRVELSQAHHNCVMTKNPEYSSVTHWHQDIRYWSFQQPQLISVWTALGREYQQNGCLLVLPGTHNMDFVPRQFDAAKFLRPELTESQTLIATQRTCELEAGDVLFFHCRLFHAAGQNHDQETKFSLVFTYHAADNQPLPGSRSASVPDVPLA